MRPPPQAGLLERRLDALAAARLAAIPMHVDAMWDAARCPQEWLSILAAGMDVPWWSTAWSVPEQRHAIGTAFASLARLGTREGVEDGLRAWGAQYRYSRVRARHFLVEVSTSGGALPASELPKLRKTLDSAKRATAHYTLGVLPGADARLQVGVVAAAIRVSPLLASAA